MFTNNSLLVLLLVAVGMSSPGLFAANAEEFLPGVEGMSPEDTESIETFLQCGDDTVVIHKLPDMLLVKDDLEKAINAKAAGTMCEKDGDDTLCTFDYEVGTATENFKEVCEADDGVFYEHDQEVSCESASVMGIPGMIRMQISNYPNCMAASCPEADAERWISTMVEFDEMAEETNLIYVCDSQYDVQETEPPAGETKTCPNSLKNTYETCSPLLPNIQNQSCDCYTFCNGFLLECESFGTGNGAEVLCADEDLVMGCTAELFVKSAGVAMTTRTLPLSVLAAIASVMWSLGP